MNTHGLTLEGRIRALLRDLQRGLCDEEDVTILIRGEVVAGFYRGIEAQKKRSGGMRSFR